MILDMVKREREIEGDNDMVGNLIANQGFGISCCFSLFSFFFFGPRESTQILDRWVLISLATKNLNVVPNELRLPLLLQFMSHKFRCEQKLDR